MEISKKVMANWGNFPTVEGVCSSPDGLEGFVEAVKGQAEITARGNGRCYGDAALGTYMVSTLNMNRLLDFDTETGEVACEAGMLLSDLLPIIVPQGWFLAVTPGTKLITIGGAVASDVHGKNHLTQGCFSQHVISFDLLRSDGTVIHCSPSENKDIFWQTFGAMGWTGIILAVRFQLVKIASAKMIQETVGANNLKDLMALFYQKEQFPYAAAWIDGNQSSGGGLAFFAQHEAVPGELSVPGESSRDIPFFAPNWLLNKASIFIHNWLYKQSHKIGNQIVTLEQYFYPLDKLRHWNRLYGRRGFIQYQFCIPENVAYEGILQILQTVREHRCSPFLMVLKRHGRRHPEAIHSFPDEGFSLAMDFPRTTAVMRLVAQLDRVLAHYGGWIYLAKDACSSPSVNRVHPASFTDRQFTSVLRKRLEAGIQK